MPDLPWLGQRSALPIRSMPESSLTPKPAKPCMPMMRMSCAYPASLDQDDDTLHGVRGARTAQIKLNTRIKFSANAAKEPPTKLGVRAGKSISVEQAIYALVTKSANDASTAVAEHPRRFSEAKFARMMTAKARSLGMSRTTFRNAHGLPNSKQVTTARDMARLGIALREHFRAGTNISPPAPSSSARPGFQITIGFWAPCAASTASRPVTPAHRASTWCHR
jgi:hypothetical protein